MITAAAPWIALAAAGLIAFGAVWAARILTAKPAPTKNLETTQDTPAPEAAGTDTPRRSPHHGEPAAAGAGDGFDELVSGLDLPAARLGAEVLAAPVSRVAAGELSEAHLGQLVTIACTGHTHWGVLLDARRAVVIQPRVITQLVRVLLDNGGETETAIVRPETVVLVRATGQVQS